MKKVTINRTNITEHLIQYQLALIDKTIEEAHADEKWYQTWTITDEKYAEFKHYAIPLLKKVFKFNKAKAESTFSWFTLQYGLRTINK